MNAPNETSLAATKLSRRAESLGTENAFVVLAEVNALVRQGKDIVSFCIGQPDFPTPPNIQEAGIAAIRTGKHGYTPSAGIDELRVAAAKDLGARRGLAFLPEDVVVGAGAKPFIAYTIASVTDYGAGDEVIYPVPGFPIYESQILANGAVPVPIYLREAREFAFDPAELEAKITPQTKLLILNTPHNPTGMVWTADDIAELRRTLEGTDAIVISDEVYEHIIFDGGMHESLARYPDIASRAIVISSFGKTYHTTGWKVGYCAAPPELTREIQGVHQWVTFAVNGAVQMAYAEMVNRDPTAADVTAFYQGRRDLFLSLIAGSRFKPLACRGTFFQLVDYSAITDERDIDFAQRLTREHGVAAIPISPFLNENEEPGPVVRFCFAKKDDTLKRAAERLARV